MQEKNIKKHIHVILDTLIKAYQPRKVILFGSYAYGNPTEDSDLDFLIIKNTDKRPIDRWVELKKILRDVSKTIPVSPLVYTEKEIEERIAMNDFFIEEVMQKGKVLYG